MPSTGVVAATRTGVGAGPSMELTQYHSNDNLNKQSTEKNSKKKSQTGPRTEVGNTQRRRLFSRCFPSVLCGNIYFL